MRYWDNDGKPLADGRFRYVIDPEDGTNPLYAYGKTKEEALEKVASMAETGQGMISRQRQQLATRVTPPARPGATPAAPRSTMPSAEDVMQATVDMDNPGKAPGALKTILRAGGVDLDGMQHDAEIRRVAAVGRAWEAANPDFPGDDQRNGRLLIDRASLRVGYKNITAEALDRAYAELLAEGMLFDDEGSRNQNPSTPPTPPDGNSATRVVRQRGTSYDRSLFRATPPAARTPKPKYTRAEIDGMNSKQLRDKLESDPEFKEAYNREFSAAS